MVGFKRCVGLATAVLAIGLMGPAVAQENLDSGKTGAQIFASDCALCHKSPQALNKSGNLFGLSGFLREHYTASRETADVVAKYLESLPNAPAPAKRGAPKRNAKGGDKAKTDEKKADDKKPDEQKVDEKKPAAKSKDKKSAKPKDAKTESSSDSKTESSDAKPAKTSKPKSDKPKSDKPKTDKKPDKQEKSD